MNKKTRRDEAIKREKRKRMILIAALIVVILIIAVPTLYNNLRPSNDRIFTDGQQTVTLHANGTFSARLAHDTQSGTYAEKQEGGVTVVSFTVGNTTVNGKIGGDVLTIPEEWDDQHGHGSQLRKK